MSASPYPSLTLDEWRAFWAAHGLSNDRGSLAVKGMAVSFHPEEFELKLALPFDPYLSGLQGYQGTQFFFVQAQRISDLTDDFAPFGRWYPPPALKRWRLAPNGCCW